MRHAPGKREPRDAAGQFDALLEREPANPLFAAYHAAAVVMQARDAWMPWNKMKYLEDGLADTDRALADAEASAREGRLRADCRSA